MTRRDGNVYYHREQMQIFRNIVRTMVREFEIAATEFKESLKSIQEFAKASDELFSMVEIAIEAAGMISNTDFSAMTVRDGDVYYQREQMQIFRNIVRTMIREFALIEEEFSSAQVKGIATLAGSINTFVTNLSKVIDGIFDVIDQLTRLAGATVPGSIGAVVLQIVNSVKSQVPAAYSAGQALGVAIGQGIKDALNASAPGLTFASGGATLVMEGGVRTVVLENGAFQVTINDTMDAEEFKFEVVEILRELTE
jgi:hypothetical protein